VMMPGESGLSLTKSLREIRPVPILMLTALAESKARIEGLEAGADDYLSKPFEPRELVLRINNILKRNAAPATPKIEQVMFGPYTFSIVRKELKRGSDAIRLTDREQEIMLLFSLRAGETIPRHELIGEETEVGERTIDVQINRLRRKIQCNSSKGLTRFSVRIRMNILRQALGATHTIAAAPSWKIRSDDHLRDLQAGYRARTGRRLEAPCPLAAPPDADGPLCPLATDHHHPHGAAPVGRRLRLHGASLAARHAAPLHCRHP